MKKIATALLIVGVALMVASVVITFLSAGNANLIGGASWPTFRFYFGKISWVTWIGACVTVAAIVAFVSKKK